LGLLLLDTPRHEHSAVATESGRGGWGRGSCITVAMPCLPGINVPDSRCASRARSRLKAPAPSGACSIDGLTAPGLSAEARDWLRIRIEKELLPRVCSCYEEGLSIRHSLRGRITARVRLKNGCGELDPGGAASLPDRFTVECVRSRFLGFSASLPVSQFPPREDRFAEELYGQSFVVTLDLRPRPTSSPR
jgi:hypothetical protein